MRNKQLGFTLIELGLLVWGLVCAVLAAGLVYCLFHFIAKFW